MRPSLPPRMSELFVLTERTARSTSHRRARAGRSCCARSASTFDVLLLREAPGRRRDVVEAARDGEPPLRIRRSASRAPRPPSAGTACSDASCRRRPVLGADTEVVLDGTRSTARRRAPPCAHARVALSGRTHDVHHCGRAALAGRSSTLRRLDLAGHVPRAIDRRDRTLRRDRRVPSDKAGGYAIQGQARLPSCSISRAATPA